MAQKFFALIVALIITVTWIGASAAQSSTPGQVLRVVTATVLPDKRDQTPQLVDEITQSLSAAKGVLWFKVGTDPVTGEIVGVQLWNSQAELDAFLKSAARNAGVERIRHLRQGEPSAKNYQVSEAKK